MHNDFEKTRGKLESVLDKYQMKMEHHKKIKKRDTVCHHSLVVTVASTPGRLCTETGS